MRTISENATSGRVSAGVRPARAARRGAEVRPGGRRSGSPLPPAVRPAVAAGPARAARPLPVHLRRRRVAVALVAVVLGALVALAAVLALAGGAAAASAPAPTVVAVVGQGESLQDVARRVAPGADPRATAAAVRELNGLPTSVVQPGRPLVVPVEATPATGPR